MDPDSITGAELKRTRIWNLLPSFLRNANTQTTATMPTTPISDLLPAIRCVILSPTQFSKDIVWSYQTPHNITSNSTFSSADISTTDIWTQSNTICYSTDLSENISPPLHTAAESTRFLLWHAVLLAGVVYLIGWICFCRTIARVIRNETLATDDGADELTAKRQRDELVAQNGELLEEHARQEVRFNEVHHARIQLGQEVAKLKNEVKVEHGKREKEVAELKNELRDADERRVRDREDDGEWDVKFDGMLVENGRLKSKVAGLRKELVNEKEKTCKCGGGNTETQIAIDCVVVKDMDKVEMKRLQDEVARRTADIDELRRESTAVNEKLRDTHEKASAEHKAQNDMLTMGMAGVISAEKKALQDEIAQLTKKTTKLRNDIAGITTENKALQNEVDLLIGDKEEYQNALDEMGTENTELQESVDALTKKNKELRKNETLQNEINDLVAEKNKAQGNFDNVMAAYKKLQGFLKERNQILKDLQNDIDQLTTGNQTLQNGSDEERELGDRMTKASEAEKARDDYMAEIKTLKSQLESRQDYVFTQAEHDRVQNDLQKEGKEAEGLEGDLKSSGRDLDFAQEELESAQKSLKAATDELKSKAEELESAQKDFRIAKGDIAGYKAAEAGHKIFKQTAQDLQDENKDLQEELENLRKEIEQKKKELEKSSKALRQLTQDAVTQNSSDNANEQLKATVGQLTTELESSKVELARKETEFQEHLATCNGPSTTAVQNDDGLFGSDPNETFLHERNDLLAQLKTARSETTAAGISKQALLVQLSQMEAELTNTRVKEFPKTQELQSLRKLVGNLHAQVLDRNKKIKQLEDDLEKATEGQEIDLKSAFSDAEDSMNGMEEIRSDDGWGENGWEEEQNQADSDETQAEADTMRPRSPSFNDENSQRHDEEARTGSGYEPDSEEDLIMKGFVEDSANGSSSGAAAGTYSADEIFQGFLNDLTGDFLHRLQDQQQPVAKSAENWGDEEPSYTCPACNEQVYEDLRESHTGNCKGGVANDPDFDVSLA